MRDDGGLALGGSTGMDEKFWILMIDLGSPIQKSQPTCPRPTPCYCPETCPSLTSSPQGPSNQRLGHHSLHLLPSHPILPITVSGVLPPKHFWGPFQDSWRILLFPCFMDPLPWPTWPQGPQDRAPDRSIVGLPFKAS